MGEAADGVVGGLELVGEDVGVGVDDAEEIVDGVRDGIELRGREAIGGCLFERRRH